MNNQVVYCESPGDDVNLIEDEEFISQNSDNKVDNSNDVLKREKCGINEAIVKLWKWSKDFKESF